MFARISFLAVVVVLLNLTSGSVQAEITSIAGSVAVAVQEYQLGQAGNTDQANDSYPGTSILPLQVVARLNTGADAAASVAAQFADPTTLNQPNPEEFALNLALLSVSDEIRYTGTATLQESRSITYAASEFPGRSEGETIALIGRLYIDGALAIFSPSASRDLTGANVTLRVTVVKHASGQDDETVFTGAVGLTGGTNGAVTRTSEGSFPTLTLIYSDLSLFVDDFNLFRVLIIPRMTISYSYNAEIGEPFTLQATVEVDATNAENEIGVVAILGTPVDSIQEVIAAAQSDSAATKTINALTTERANPTGEPAFPSTSQPILPFCGLFGFEMIAGFACLVGLRCGGPRRFRR